MQNVLIFPNLIITRGRVISGRFAASDLPNLIT
jgi:hypothetical protein